jgi:hypothetical protein
MHFVDQWGPSPREGQRLLVLQAGYHQLSDPLFGLLAEFVRRLFEEYLK